jgi:NADH:ubiquinone oxidoreductase subunit C
MEGTSRISAADWPERAKALRAEGWLLVDLAGVDRLSLDGFDHRFDIAVQLLNMERKERMTINVEAEGDPPTLPSITEVWPTANFMEREAYDLLGISFEGHPNLTRILMPDEWEGHPLRKDYGVGKVPVEFIAQPFMQIETPGQAPNVREADADVDELGQVRPARAGGSE